jgi:hypothetical protein
MENMLEKLSILFHGSTKKIEVYEISLSMNLLPCDFANGFYTTPRQEEAIEWALLKEPKSIVVNEYEWNLEEAASLSIMVFDSADAQWFDFVRHSRLNGLRPTEYDVIVGPVATGNDVKLMNSKDSPEELSGLISEHEKDQRGLQVVFCSDKAVNTLSLKGDIVVSVFEEVRKYG